MTFGLCGPITMKQKPSEKHWPPSKTNRSEHKMGLYLKKEWGIVRCNIWLTYYKHYGAEYYDEDN